MSYGNKDNNREYINRNNSNQSKVQSMNDLDVNLCQQFGNFNGDNFLNDMKHPRDSASPKQWSEISQLYLFKNDNSRTRYFSTKYNDRSTYYSQPRNSSNDIAIPEIDHLKEFIREQSEFFNIELGKYEDQKIFRANFHQTQNQQQRTQPKLPLSGQGLHTSNLLGIITRTAVASIPVSVPMKSGSNKLFPSYVKSNNLKRNQSNDNTFISVSPTDRNEANSPGSTMLENLIINKSQSTVSNIGKSRQENKSNKNFCEKGHF